MSLMDEMLRWNILRRRTTVSQPERNLGCSVTRDHHSGMPFPLFWDWYRSLLGTLFFSFFLILGGQCHVFILTPFFEPSPDSEYGVPPHVGRRPSEPPNPTTSDGPQPEGEAPG